MVPPCADTLASMKVFSVAFIPVGTLGLLALRSGAPDFLDTLVASTFGSMAYDALTQNKHGLMASITNGKFSMVTI